VDNVAWILRNGLHCSSSSVLDPNFVPIGMRELIDRRRHRQVPVAPNGTLGDYVPFYFTPWSPMLLNIKTGRNGVIQRPNREIAIFVSSLPNLARLNSQCLFTNAHAYANEAEYFSNLCDLHRIDWNLLRARDFRGDPEDPGKISRYMAEALVFQHVPVGAILGIVCYEDGVKNRLDAAAQGAAALMDIRVRPNWYF
jgi:hypothetical protein